MARQEVRALILLLRGRDIRGGAFRVMWAALLGVAALMLFSASSRFQAAPAALETERAALQPFDPHAARAVLLSTPPSEPQYCEQALDGSPLEELAALEWEDLEDDARPDSIVSSITARLRSLLALDAPLLRPRAALPASQLCGSTALPRGPPAHS